ncbi:MAG: hypothetical protein ACR2MQ_14980 [Gemmatimonadaceae bacterium]
MDFSDATGSAGIAASGKTHYARALEWIQVVPGESYFSTETGGSWTPVGQNDAITWPELEGLFRRKDVEATEQYFSLLTSSGVTCLRLMLEYCQGEHRYIETRAGHFAPNVVRLWDDLFALCEQHGLRILLTPFDTFWMWRRWGHHPYNRKNGGPSRRRSHWLLCSVTRAAIKTRLTFAVERWGGSGALFAWDLWNEIHPGHAEEKADVFADFITDLSEHVRECEQRLYGRSHPQTVSMFGPEIIRRPWLDLATPIFRHPSLDFATIHVYAEGTIDAPRNTVAPAVSMGSIVRNAIAEIRDRRPFLDTEHGPIKTFKDLKVTLPEDFDDEYFRHMQWAHLASGGAGGGMRWPNRHPHTLTTGMRLAQRSMATFLPLIDWRRFQRRNINDEMVVSSAACWAQFGCADQTQALLWLLRSDNLDARGMVRRNTAAVDVSVTIPELQAGWYRVQSWDTTGATVRCVSEVDHNGIGDLTVQLGAVATDVAVAVSCYLE